MFGKLKSWSTWKVGSVRVLLEMGLSGLCASWWTRFSELSWVLRQHIHKGTGTEITLPDHPAMARHVPPA